MEYQVPQFIEVEDKIFGPLSLKQFIYVAGGVGICVVLILYLPLWLGILIAAPIAAFTAALAFYRINNKPFVEILESGFNFLTSSRLYLWQKDKPATPDAVVSPTPEILERQKLGLSRSKLHDLAWSLDIKDQNADDSII
jgi:hypothetical protein